MKVLGVLGGMGPAATVAFLARVQALSGAAHEEDHVHVLADINPRVPNRHTAPEAAGVELGRMAARLRDAGAEVLAMPCNTAHAHAGAIRAAGLPFLDMIALTAAEAARGGARRVGVLATPGGEALYRAALEGLGVEAVTLDGEDRAAFMQAVFAAKGSAIDPAARAGMARLAGALVATGAEALIGGCTEVPLLLDAADAPVPLTDSAEVLAAACVAACA